MDLKLTTRSQEAMAEAVRRASTDGHPQVEPAHLLAALLGQVDGVAPALLRAAGEAARELGDEYVSTEHLLIGLASADSAPGSVGATLARAGATRKALLAALPGVRGNARVTSPEPEGTYNALDKYSLDLTAAAREGRLDPVIGRDAEIRRVIQRSEEHTSELQSR